MIRGFLFAPCAVLLALGSGCVASAAPSEPDPAEAQAEQLQSSPLADDQMHAIRTPAGMPRPWTQPDSTGYFGEQGKCGPTAVSNALRLYGIELSPDDAYADGVHWFIGTRGLQIRDFFDENHPELQCSLEHPTDGPAFLRAELAQKHPVLVWFNTQGGWSSHWVTAVGISHVGAAENVIVMSWGRYYTIDIHELDDAWRNVYGIRRPAIACRKPAKTMVK